jgi:hypothetical protein
MEAVCLELNSEREVCNLLFWNKKKGLTPLFLFIYIDQSRSQGIGELRWLIRIIVSKL